MTMNLNGGGIILGIILGMRCQKRENGIELEGEGKNILVRGLEVFGIVVKEIREMLVYIFGQCLEMNSTGPCSDDCIYFL